MGRLSSSLAQEHAENGMVRCLIGMRINRPSPGFDKGQNMVDANGQEITTSPASWIAATLRWLFGQEAVVILLIANLALVSYVVQMAATTWIPSHLNQIQAGYEKITNQHEVIRDKERAADVEARKEYRELLLRGAGVGAADVEEMGLLR